MSVGGDGALWTLVAAAHDAVISRLTRAGCSESERLPATALAVDATTIYLSLPGGGIATHAFEPARTCASGPSAT
jgi:hypothetical protein